MLRTQGLQARDPCCHENGHQSSYPLSTSVFNTCVYVYFFIYFLVLSSNDVSSIFPILVSKECLQFSGARDQMSLCKALFVDASPKYHGLWVAWMECQMLFTLPKPLRMLHTCSIVPKGYIFILCDEHVTHVSLLVRVA